MRLLLEDGFSIEKGTGIGRYTQNLARELGIYPGVEILPPPARKLVQKIRPFSARRMAYAAWLETAFQTQVDRLGADLVHFTNYLVPRKRKSRARYAVTIHDLTAWRMPQALPSIYGRYIRTVISRAVKTADLILCPTHSVRKETIELFGLKEESVRTAWNADSRLPRLSPQVQEELSDQFCRKLGLRRPFMLFVGTLERRKNITTLVKAFAHVARTTNLQLVMAGRPGYGFPEIKAAVNRQLCRDRCILAGYVSNKQLSLLYTLADLFVYPSCYEGFGIPLVEAMSFELPIVASRIPASEEVAGDAALYYEDPLNDLDLAGRINDVLSDSTLKAEFGARGRQRAERFKWEHVVRMYVDAYKSSLGGE